ncbi:class I adenylate-forming enzyme family protein [Gorillibacterium sp. CAU 1737]|uniref:class I adenylate-forming enzyme family protein n=1 Tax=Gorillibacterium sp. CAU 1737 TaxID=3140362 RepID=UPI00326186ED
MSSARSPWELFQQSCDRYASSPMLIYNDQTQSYEEIHRKVQAFAELIRPWSFRMGGVYLPNSPAFLIAMLGLKSEGKVFVSLSYQFKGDALFELMDYADVELLVTDTKGWETIQPRAEEGNLRVVLELLPDESFRVHELPNKARLLPDIGEDVFGICFTSGSTARPKGIILSNSAVAGNAVAIADYLDYGVQERIIIPRSLAQSSPIAGDALTAISRGGAIILMNNVFHPAIFLKAVQEYQAEQFFIVRTMLQQILDYPNRHAYDVSSVKRILMGGMINPIRIFQDAASAFPNARMYNAYGASEAVARVTFAPHEEATQMPWVIGKPLTGCSIRILREDGTEAGPGETGEIYIQSEYLMDGYYKQEQATREALTPQGFRVKDVGYQDHEGRYFVLGRSDDLINQGGSKVYPTDIEEVLMRHAAVCEALVLGVEDAKLGQRIVAFVSLKDGAPSDRSDLNRWCSLQLEDRKVPKEIHIVDAIPRNTIGKINRKEVRALFQDRLEVAASTNKTVHPLQGGDSHESK